MTQEIGLGNIALLYCGYATRQSTSLLQMKLNFRDEHAAYNLLFEGLMNEGRVL